MKRICFKTFADRKVSIGEAQANVRYFEARVIKHAMLTNATSRGNWPEHGVGLLNLRERVRLRLLSLNEACERLREARAKLRRVVNSTCPGIQ